MKAIELVQQSDRNAAYYVRDSAPILGSFFKMKRTGREALAVVNSAGEMVGIVYEKDCIEGVLLRLNGSNRSLVKDIMTKEFVVANPEDSLEFCMNLMIKNKAFDLPIVSAGKCYGFLSVLDVAGYLLDVREGLIDQLNKYICDSQFVKPLVIVQDYQATGW